VIRRIDAPVDAVFQTVSNVENMAKAVPHIVKTEFLSDVRSGVGARFRETRVMNGREGTTVLEVTEYAENEHIRIVADEGGTVWDTVFTVEADGDGTRLEMVMDAKPYQLKAKLMTPMIMGMIKKAVESDMDAVKSYCESL